MKQVTNVKQTKTTDCEDRTSTVPIREINYWRKEICPKAIELWIDCHYANESRKAFDRMRRGTGDGTHDNDINESILAALKLARTQFRAMARESKGAWALAKLSKRTKAAA